MHDAAFETRRAKKRKQHGRIKAIGLSFFGLFAVALIISAFMPFINLARESARQRRLMMLPYPDPPTKPGVYALERTTHPALGGTILFTPLMPVQLDALTAQGATTRVHFELRDMIDGVLRVEPVQDVSISFRAPPRTWLVHDGRVLTITADGKTIRRVHKGEYYGDGWGLAKADRLDFDIPTEFFVRMSAAKQVTGVLEGSPFTITPDEQAALRDFAAYLAPGIEIKPPH